MSLKGFLVFLTGLILVSWQPLRKTKVYLIGDSTMCFYEAERGPITGWGMPFAEFFDSTIQIDNRAKGGRSTRTFISENRWQPIVEELVPGDYVLIQFGHNDEAKEEKYKDRYTPVEDYKSNLTRFVNETRGKGGIPVLITPVTRMRFDKAGQQQETHKEYTAAVFEVGNSLKVPVIDLDLKSRNLVQEMGPDNAGLLYLQLPAGAHPNYPDGVKDNTHFNEYGARRIAELVLESIRETQPGLAQHIKTPKLKG